MSEKKDVELSREELEWIKTVETLSEMPQGIGVRDKMSKKIKENPIVPLGMFLTTCALSYGLWSMRKGDKVMSQKMMRARIYAQGFTLCAILGGVFFAAKLKPDAKS